MNFLVAVGFALIVVGVIVSLAVSSASGYAVMILGWVVLMVDWQRQRGVSRTP